MVEARMKTTKSIHPCPGFLGLQVKYFRKKSGLTQKDLSEKTGIKLRHLQEIEAGRVDIKLRTLGHLALGFNIKPAELLTPVEDGRSIFCANCQNLLLEM